MSNNKPKQPSPEIHDAILNSTKENFIKNDKGVEFHIESDTIYPVEVKEYIATNRIALEKLDLISIEGDVKELKLRIHVEDQEGLSRHLGLQSS